METIGQRIKEMRLLRKMTLAVLSKEAGVSVSFLSQVERNLVLPSIATLQKLASALRVSSGQLMDGAEPANPVVRKNARMRLRLPNSEIDRECLTPSLNHRLQVFSARLEPGERSSEIPLQHNSEEFMLVLKGVLEIHVGGNSYVLKNGDTILYSALQPHYTSCVGDRPTEYIVVNTPPVI